MNIQPIVEGHGEPDTADNDNPKGYGGFHAALESENYSVKPLLLRHAGILTQPGP